MAELAEILFGLGRVVGWVEAAVLASLDAEGRAAVVGGCAGGIDG